MNCQFEESELPLWSSEESELTFRRSEESEVGVGLLITLLRNAAENSNWIRAKLNFTSDDLASILQVHLTM